MGHKDKINIISPNLDDLLIFFLILLLIPSAIIAHFTSFNLLSVYVLLFVSFLSIFTLSHLLIYKVKPNEIKKVGAKYIVSGLSLLLIVLLIPAAVIENLVHLPFVLIYMILLIIFFILTVVLAVGHN
jgi:hypothetical protein